MTLLPVPGWSEVAAGESAPAIVQDRRWRMSLVWTVVGLNLGALGALAWLLWGR
ncbi:hypothetical protein [Lichenibacterium ramalinae]|uniref:hypothetical protein n=1 Tax=Lichenibacterium ramalinae TaxID=2316527 RepID=UPI0013ECC88D|nr:hypothetical protein [Lichenibacterium ramalinae]